MLRRILPPQVVVSLGVAIVIIGCIVLAGVLLRHRDPTGHRRAPAPLTAQPAPAGG